MAVTADRIDTATVLFTDLVGSTALRSRIGEEAADALRVTHDRLVGDAIASVRGVVVKHTGDGMMATFPAAVDAVAAGIAIQQAVDGHNRRGAEERFEVRVGISVGDVTFTADDCFGLPVIEAQRLEAAAGGGQILCAEIVRHLARGRGGYEFVSIGDLDLKGIPDPVPAVEVRWEPVVQIAMPRETPLPPVLARPPGFDLAGRQAEFDALLDAWKESAEGRRNVVLLSGEPGIGKTRLATETALVARHQGGLVLAGRCDEELELSFQPFAEALRFQLELADDVPATWFGPLAGELVRLVPELADRIPGLAPPTSGDPDAERMRLFEAVTGWLRTTAASVPVLFVLDDIHWADRPTLLLLRHLIHETAHDAVCIVGTYRSTDLDRTHPLAAMLADLRRDESTTRIALDGLSADGVAELLERAAGHDLDSAGVALATALSNETAGNPFFVGEIVRHLVESGALVVRDGRWTSDLTLDAVGLPEGVREVVGRRISHLDDDSQRLLSVAAVIGHEFSLPVLATVSGIDEDRALDLLDHVRASSLIDEVGLDRYRFGHALVRATLIDELTTTRRVRTHRKIAETIETQNAADLDAVVTELAYHYGEAAAAEPEKAIEYATRAARRAYESAAADDAVRWYALALEHVEAGDGDPATEVELLTRLGQAEFVLGTDSGAVHLRDAARRAKAAGLDRAMADALLVSTRRSFDEEQESDPERIALLEDAVTRFDDDAAIQARLMAMLAVELLFVGDRERRAQLLDEAYVLAKSSGDPAAIIEVTLCTFNARPRSLWTYALAHQDDARHVATIAASDTLGTDYYYRPGVFLTAFFSALTVNDGGAARHLVARLSTDAEAGRGGWLGIALLAQQMVTTMEGRLVEAEALSIEQFEIGRKVGTAEAITYRATEQLAVRREQDRIGEIIPAWSAFLAGRPRAASSASTIAFALAESGDLDAAATRLDDAWRAGFADMPDDAGWPLAVAGWSEVAASVAHREAAAELHTLLRPMDGLSVGTGGIHLGPAARLLARLELTLDQMPEADAHFAAAIEQSMAVGSPVWVARDCLDWAEAFAARGEGDRARPLVAQAERAIADLSLPRLERQSAELHELLDS